MEANSKYINNTLKQHREMQNFRIKDVASLLGVDRQHLIGKWENGEMLPSAAQLLKLSILYRTRPSELYPELHTQYVAEILDMLSKRNNSLR